MRTLKSSVLALAAATALMLSAAGCSSQDAAKRESASKTPANSSSAAEPMLFSYQFPHGLVRGWEDWDGPMSANPINATLAVPSTPGPHPVVTLFQATLPGCIWAEKDKMVTSDAVITTFPEACVEKEAELTSGLTSGQDYFRAPASYGYLMKELASRGFAVVAPDLGGAGQLWSGENDATHVTKELVALHHKILTDLAEGRDHGLPWADKVKGAFDFSQQYYVGHSSSGDAVLTYSQDKKNAELQQRLKAIVALEPAWGRPTNKKITVPTLVITGRCDEQVGFKHQAKYVKTYAKANPTTPIVTATMAETTHLGLVTGTVAQVSGNLYTPDPGTCGKGQVADPADQQGQAAELIADFLEQTQAGDTAYQLGVSDAMQVELAALTKAATVEAKPVTQLPSIVDPHTFTFDKSPDRVAPKPGKKHWGGTESDEGMGGQDGQVYGG